MSSIGLSLDQQITPVAHEVMTEEDVSQIYAMFCIDYLEKMGDDLVESCESRRGDSIYRLRDKADISFKALQNPSKKSLQSIVDGVRQRTLAILSGVDRESFRELKFAAVGPFQGLIWAFATPQLDLNVCLEKRQFDAAIELADMILEPLERFQARQEVVGWFTNHGNSDLPMPSAVREFNSDLFDKLSEIGNLVGEGKFGEALEKAQQIQPAHSREFAICNIVFKCILCQKFDVAKKIVDDLQRGTLLKDICNQYIALGMTGALRSNETPWNEKIVPKESIFLMTYLSGYFLLAQPDPNLLRDALIAVNQISNKSLQSDTRDLVLDKLVDADEFDPIIETLKDTQDLYFLCERMLECDEFDRVLRAVPSLNMLQQKRIFKKLEEALCPEEALSFNRPDYSNCVSQSLAPLENELLNPISYEGISDPTVLSINALYIAAMQGGSAGVVLLLLDNGRLDEADKVAGSIDDPGIREYCRDIIHPAPKEESPKKKHKSA